MWSGYAFCSRHIDTIPANINVLKLWWFVLKIILILIAVVVVLYACTRSPGHKPDQSFQAYFDAISQHPASHQADAKQQMQRVFADMSEGATAETIEAVYAKDLYFNDTFKIITDRDKLVEYLSETAQNADTKVEILEVIKSDDDYYVRWRMQMAFSAVGKDIESNSVGISQLRFNEHGQITFQHDFWNSSEAFYEHLPFIGRFLIKIKQRL